MPVEQHFINPYNWAPFPVTTARKPLRLHRTGTDILSGTIAVRFTTVTPLLVGGKRTEQPNGHKQISFFQILRDGKMSTAIGAATLKGAVRSVFEVITGSCTVFRDPNDYYGSRDAGRARDFECAVVETVPTQATDGRLRLCDKALVLPHVLKAAKIEPKANKAEGGPHETIPVLCKWHEEGNHLRAESVLKVPPGNANGFRHLTGDATLKPENVPSSLLPVNVQNAAQNGNGVVVSYRRGKRQGNLVPPVSSINGQVTNKSLFTGELVLRNGRFELTPHRKYVIARPRNGNDNDNLLRISWEEYSKYLSVQRNGLRAEEGKLKLSPGDVVFVKVKVGEGKGTGLTRAAIGLSAFGVPLSKLVPESVEPCFFHNKNKDPELWEVCPACQTFGFVEDKRQTGRKTEAACFSGSVRFSHAVITGGEWLPRAPLAVLSSPKPSCTPFYLEPNGAAADIYRDGARLRGRKIYVAANSLRPGQWERNPATVDNDPQGRAKLEDNQNSSAAPLKPGAHFDFAVQFDDLTREQLGALLYALQFKGCLHGIGMGRPLGLGAARCTSLEVATRSRQQFLTLSLLGKARAERETACTEEEIQQCIADFADTRVPTPAGTEVLARVQALEELPDVKALRSIRADTRRELPVMYPTKLSNGQLEGFAWFVDHASVRANGDLRPLPAWEKLDTVAAQRLYGTGEALLTTLSANMPAPPVAQGPPRPAELPQVPEGQIVEAPVDLNACEGSYVLFRVESRNPNNGRLKLVAVIAGTNVLGHLQPPDNAGQRNALLQVGETYPFFVLRVANGALNVLIERRA